MNYIVDNKSEYIVWIISDFAKRYGLDNVKAYDYLSKFKAIDFIDNFYDVLHTFSFDDAVTDIAKYCRRNGGDL